MSNILKKSADNDPRSAAHGDLLAALKRVHDNDPKQGGLVPVWYLLADDNGTLRCYLSGASIGRVMQGRSWTEIMGNYAPCADTDALCPGCALFGTVKGKGTSGRVRFTDAEAAQYESLGNKTLPILSGPKPSAYEFYLEKPKSTYETSIGFWNYDFCSLEETKCSPDGTKQTIKKFRVYTPQPRGRKFYWHSAPRTENERSNQNATLEAMKGTFKGSVYFDRITRAQLEELAFVLTLGENTPASPRLHKIGHGKPVGYGSCKITLTGGEPFQQPAACAELARRAHQKGLNVWSYSGYTYEKLRELARGDEAVNALLSEIDVLVDGPFLLKERSLELLYCGSKNQRIIDMKKTRETGEAVLWTPPEW